MIKYILSVFFVVCFVLKSRAQVDTSFWFVAPDVSAIVGDAPVFLHFQTYNQSSVIYVRQPANLAGVSFSFTIPSNTIISINLTASLTSIESSPTNSVSNKGIYISSKENISVYYTIGSAFNKEMISLKGQRAVGSDFFIPIPSSTSVTTYPVFDGGVGFDVVATQTGVTTILITPRAACVGRAKNITFVKSLNFGETFSVRDNALVNPSELSGSIVSADKNIAVTISGVIQTNSLCPSYFADQITTSDNVGKDYVIVKGDSQTDIAYILSPQNGSSFTFATASSTVSWLINQGETYSISITDPILYIKADKPIYAIHISGYGCKLSAAQLAPAYCAGSYTSAFTRLSSDSLNLNIVTRSGFQSSFTLTSNSNPVLISGNSFTTVPGSGGDLVAARIYYSTVSIPVGSHNELKNQNDIFGLSVRNGGTSGGSAYAYASEFAINSFVFANSIPTATICSNTQFTLNGLVGGGPIFGVWNFIGFGTLSAPNNQLLNNVYTPNPVDTNIKPVKIILTSTGICPVKTDTLKLTVKQSPIVTAGSNSIICANNPTVQLEGVVFGATNQGEWNVLSPGSGIFNPNNTLLNPTYSLSAADLFLPQLQFVLTSTNNAGCNPESSTVSITVNQPASVVASTLSPILKCSNNSTVALVGAITGTTTSTGVWSSAGTGLFFPNNLSLSNSYVPSVGDIANGSVWLKLFSTNNLQCKTVGDSVEIIFSEPSLVNAGNDLNTCNNNPKVVLFGSISGTSTSSGIWAGGTGTFTPSNTVLSPIYEATPAEVLNGFLNLTFSTTNNGNCLATTDQMRIDFQSKPIANFTANAVCLKNITTFKDQSLNPAGLGTVNGWNWNFGDGSPPTGVSKPFHTYPTNGTFTTQLIVRNTYNCFDTIRKAVTVFELPVSDFGVGRSCEGSAQKISFTDASNIPATTNSLSSPYYWDFGGYGISFAKDTSIVFPSEGNYNITHVVTTTNNCKTVITKSVQISPRPIARFVYINNSLPSLGADVTFRDTSLYAVSWDWDFGNGSYSQLENPASFYSQNGTYTVTLKVGDQYQCTSSYTAEVKIYTIVSEIAKLIPNFISPNNDGKNDYWRLDFIQVFFPKAEIEIFNRWGVKLFRSEGYSNAWDGSYKGDPLPVGAYLFTIKLNDRENTPVFKGTVTLLK
jgi:gliding motility-associated-like protein